MPTAPRPRPLPRASGGPAARTPARHARARLAVARLAVARLVLTIGAPAAAALAACARDASPIRADTTGPLRADTAGTASGALDARQLGALVSQLDAAEVGAAQGALPKLGDATVRGFAQAMIAEHATLDSARRHLPALAEPPATPPAQWITLRAAAHHGSAVLDALPAGPALDRAYMATAVADHAMALDSLRHWRTAVHDATVAAAVDRATVVVQEHLGRARAILGALGGGVADSARAPRPPLRPVTREVEQAAGSLDRRPPDTTIGPSSRRTRPDTTRPDTTRP